MTEIGINQGMEDRDTGLCDGWIITDELEKIYG